MAAEAISPTLALQATLSTAELATFLDRCGAAAPLTLRPDGAGVVIDAPFLTRLAAAGLIAEDMPGTPGRPLHAAVADVLLAPGCVIELAIWNDAQEGRTTIAFPGSPVVGAGVIVNRSGDLVHLAGFVDEGAVIALVEPLLAAVPPTVATRFEARLARSSAAVLAALLDMTAQDGGGPQGTRAFSARHVGEWLSIWWGASARTGLTGQVFALTFDPDPPEAAKVVEELERFAGADFVARDDAGRFRPTPDLVAASAILRAIDGGFDFHRLDVADDERVTGRIVHVMTGPAGALVLERLAGDRIGLRAVGRVELAGLSAALVATDTASAPATVAIGAGPTPVAVTADEPGGAARKPIHRFCSHCGTRLEADWIFCGGCGVPLKR